MNNNNYINTHNNNDSSSKKNIIKETGKGEGSRGEDKGAV